MNSVTTASIHIVRRYGPVGGMERYVWELSHALAAQGQSVQILCEKSFKTPHHNIVVHELGELAPKPRWLSMLRFSKKITNWVKHTDTSNVIIHSHERSSVHDITTFHGPPFVERKKKLLDALSPRIWAWKYLERRELCGHNVITVLPNSLLISNLLSQHYPCCQNKLDNPAYPGVSEHYFSILRKQNRNTVGFIGKEWKRKGLEQACLIITKLRASMPTLRFIVAGPDPEDIQHLFIGWPEQSYKLIGWKQTEDFLTEIDLLLHPARTEPFGMVIAEANAAGCKVVISDQCGITPLLTSKMGQSIPLKANIDEWCSTVHEQLLSADTTEKLSLRWTTLAKQHQDLYQKILSAKGSQGSD